MAAFDVTICDHSTPNHQPHQDSTGRSSKLAHNGRHHSDRRREREELLTNLWSHVWTKRQSPEWKPRRASVATCLRRYNSNNATCNSLGQRHHNLHCEQQQQQHRDLYANLLCPTTDRGKGSLSTIHQTLADTIIKKYLTQRLDQQAAAVGAPAADSGSNKNEVNDSRQSGDAHTPTVQPQRLRCSTDFGEKEGASTLVATSTNDHQHIESGGNQGDVISRQELTSQATNSSCSSAHHDKITACKPAGRRQQQQQQQQRVNLNRSSLADSDVTALSATDESGQANFSQKMDTNRQEPPRNQLQPQNVTCCSASSSAAAATSFCPSFSTASLGIEELETGAGEGSQEKAAAAAVARAVESNRPSPPTACLALNRKPHLQDKQRKSLIYSMALRQMMGLIGERSQCGGVAGPATTTSCCAATCEAQRNNSKAGGRETSQQQQSPAHLHLYLKQQHQQQAATNSPPKTVSDNDNSSPLIDHPKLVSSTATTTPMTCCHVSGQDKAVKVKSVRVERSASSGQMREWRSSASPSRLRKRTSDGGVSRRNCSVTDLDEDEGSVQEADSAGRKRRVKNEEIMLAQHKQLEKQRCRSGTSQSIGSCDFESNFSEPNSESEGENFEFSENETMMILTVKNRDANTCGPPSPTDSQVNTTAPASALGCGYCDHQQQPEHRHTGLGSGSSENPHTKFEDECENSRELESLIIESWLDDHPSFVRDYFMRKASRQLIDDWLVAHTKVSNTNLLSSQLDLSTSNNPNSSLNHANNQPPYQQQGVRVPAANGFGRSTRSSSGQSGHATPVRKISATDFESRTGSGFLRPMVSTTPDGRPTFLSQPNQSLCNDDLDEDSRHHQTVLQQAASRSSLKASGGSAKSSEQHPLSVSETFEHVALLETASGSMIDNNDELIEKIKNEGDDVATTATDEQGPDGECVEDDDEDEDYYDDDDTTIDREVKLIFELVKNICNDLDIKTLLHKILKNIAVLINADKSSLFLVHGQPGDPNRHLVSQLFNVDQDSEEVNEDGGGASDCITIPWGRGLVGYVAESGKSVNIENCYDDPRFTNTIDQRTGYVTRHMLCAPILDKRNEIVGVAQVINKRDGNPFSKSDELKFKRYLQFCGIGLRNAQSYENCQLENRRNQVLLDLARMVFEEQSTIEQVVYRIMLHTQSLLECQRCQVLLIDDGSDDLEQLLQLSNSSGSLYHQQGPIRQHKDSTLVGNENVEPETPKPEWRPQCNTAAAIAHEASIHHDRKGDNNNNSNSNSNSGPDSGNGGRARHLQGDALQTQSPPKLFSLVFDLECDGNDPVMHSNKEGGPKGTGGGAGGGVAEKLERRFPINIGITGYVAMTGETLNIEDAYQNERFDTSVDLNSNFRHKSILCMPIRNGQRQIIGVSQLINKKNGRPFNKNDEDLFEAFAIFCGLGIHNTLMYEKVLKIMAKQRVTFEVLSYHATAPLEEAKKLNSEIIPSCFALNLTSLKFNDFSLDEQFMLKSCLRIFLDLDLMRRFQIDQLVFCNWILSVQKNYRKVTYHPIVGGNGLTASPVRYHNWRHAFNVSQMMFAILINTQICQALGELETLALLIACLCHDLDHRGTNNSFQIKSASPLAELYSTSTMEHHHFDQCVMILNSQGNQILANLSPDEYSRVIVLLEEAILATDLANYFQKRELFFRLVNGNKFEWNNNPEHRSLLRCMLMTACDVAAITKPWPVQKVVADLVMSEFYQQGDIEKQELNIEPIDMMNREKRSKLPEMQIGFIDSICAPIYAAFARLFPHELSPLLDGCLSNRNIWADMSKNNQIETDLSSDNHLNNSGALTTVTILPESNQPDDDNIYLSDSSPFKDHDSSPVTSCLLISDHCDSQHIFINQQDTINNQRKSV